jgi:anion-transporting  ArsA/GET3 family ATPase
MSAAWERLPPLVVVTGKGGVGKTIVSCALARARARAGGRVLLLELDARESLHRFLGCPPSGGEVVEVEANLEAQSLRPREVVDRLIEERVRPGWIARRVLASVIYEQFVQGAPGLREVAALGYAMRAARGESGRGPAPDLVVLDAPASGHGVALLQAPSLLAEAIRSGPVGELAADVAAMIENREACALWAVSTLEDMALRETMELDDSLTAALGRGLDLLAINRVLPLGGGIDAAEPWQDFWTRRAELQRERAAALVASWTRPLVQLPLSGHEGSTAVAELERCLVDGLHE